jgi:subtilisin-like proprotein convertase family protein
MSTSTANAQPESTTFEIGEVLKIKGSAFKVSLFDPFCGTLGLKLISPQEALYLKEHPTDNVEYQMYADVTRAKFAHRKRPSTS